MMFYSFNLTEEPQFSGALLLLRGAVLTALEQNLAAGIFIEGWKEEGDE